MRKERGKEHDKGDRTSPGGGHRPCGKESVHLTRPELKCCQKFRLLRLYSVLEGMAQREHDKAPHDRCGCTCVGRN